MSILCSNKIFLINFLLFDFSKPLMFQLNMFIFIINMFIFIRKVSDSVEELQYLNLLLDYYYLFYLICHLVHEIRVVY
jgi:hypothetical protein